MKVRHLLFFVLLAAFAVCGCIFSPDNDEDTPPPPPPTCSTARTPDEAMEEFRTVYADRNLDCYRKLLSRDYLFIDQNGGFDNFDDEIAIADKMFNGLEGDNQIIIQDITIDLLAPQGVWEPTPVNDPNFGGFPDSQWRHYLVEFNFSISGQNLILRVTGPVKYFVVDEGDGSPDFKILGMEDATYGG